MMAPRKAWEAQYAWFEVGLHDHLRHVHASRQPVTALSASISTLTRRRQLQADKLRDSQ